MLARKGEDPAGPWLFTAGGAVFMKEHNAVPLGFGGGRVLGEPTGTNENLYTVRRRRPPSPRTSAQSADPSYWARVHPRPPV